MHFKHTAETSPFMHQMKCLINLSKSQIVSYVLINLYFLQYEQWGWISSWHSLWGFYKLFWHKWRGKGRFILTPLLHEGWFLIDCATLEVQIIYYSVKETRVKCVTFFKYFSTSQGTCERLLKPPKAVPFQTRPVTNWKGRVDISCPDAATPTITDVPQP